MGSVSTILVIVCIICSGIYGAWHWISVYRYFGVVLQRWADAEGYRIVGRERSWGYGSPFAWRTSRHQQVFHVLVEDQHGRRRLGWVQCGSWGGFNPDQVAVVWEDTRARR
jgi:hypothetical protein